jgi:hypothetical protein
MLMMPQLLSAAFLLASAARVGAGWAGATRFPVVWNVGAGYDSINGSVPAPGWPHSLTAGFQCNHPGAFYPSVNVSALFGLQNCSRIQCGPGCTNPPCADWTQGLFPQLKAGQPVHGGVPQAANLSAHLANLRATVPKWIPDPGPAQGC